MAEAAQHGNIGVVMDGPSGQRLVERLARCGLAAYVVLPGALEHEALAGQCYLAPLSMAPFAGTLVQRGIHICLIPPWPAAMATIGATAVGVAAVERRGAVRLSPALADDPPGQVGALTSLKILYREQLLGAFGTVLAESEYGEALLATLPRASNRHGYIVVSSLQLSVASAQTRFEDVARLLEYLLIWCATHAEPAAPPYQQQARDAEGDDPSEQFAPIVLLALALALPQQSTTATQHEPTHGDVMADRESVRREFDRVCRMLALSIESPAFDMGWAQLEAHGVVSSPMGDATSNATGDATQVHRDALERWSANWQLGPRLRRLRRLRQSEGDG